MCTIRAIRRTPKITSDWPEFDEIPANYRVLGITTHTFVDRKGIIREIHVRAMSKKTMEKQPAQVIGPAQP